MFQLSDIQNAHTKVKTGVDFPKYIQEIKKLGVVRYETFVSDGHITYFGTEDFSLIAPSKHEPVSIALQSDTEEFQKRLKIHQQGGSDYITFWNDAARTGVEKWIIDIQNMTCTYYDVQGNQMLVEKIPEVL